jgi:hypothetical protein
LLSSMKSSRHSGNIVHAHDPPLRRSASSIPPTITGESLTAAQRFHTAMAKADFAARPLALTDRTCFDGEHD